MLRSQQSESGPEMIEAANRTYPEQKWLLADVSQWTSSGPVDLIYSNAALQWLPDHGALLSRLLGMVAAGGALAFQIPSSTYATVRTLIHDISNRRDRSERLNAARNTLTMECPAFYYDALVNLSTNLDIWETEYSHVMESAAAIVDWISSTGLRPFLAALDTDAERAEFTAELHQRVRDAYQIRADGKVLFPFRRTFVIAYR
jgi:trans-aconitate 2-methyltransferase